MEGVSNHTDRTRTDGPVDTGEAETEEIEIACAHLDQKCARQSHVHEFTGSAVMTDEGGAWHGHRFTGLSGEAIYVPGSHVHRIAAQTDYAGHYHTMRCITGPATFLLDRSARKSDRKHVHFAEGTTTETDGHRHRFHFATLLEAPLEEEDEDGRD